MKADWTLLRAFQRLAVVALATPPSSMARAEPADIVVTEQGVEIAPHDTGDRVVVRGEILNRGDAVAVGPTIELVIYARGLAPTQKYYLRASADILAPRERAPFDADFAWPRGAELNAAEIHIVRGYEAATRFSLTSFGFMIDDEFGPLLDRVQGVLTNISDETAPTPLVDLVVHPIEASDTPIATIRVEPSVAQLEPGQSMRFEAHVPDVFAQPYSIDPRLIDRSGQ